MFNKKSKLIFPIIFLILSLLLFGCGSKKAVPQPQTTKPAIKNTETQNNNQSDNQKTEKELQPIKELPKEEEDNNSQTEKKPQVKNSPQIKNNSQEGTSATSGAAPKGSETTNSKPQPVTNPDLSLYSLGYPIDLRNDAAKTDKEKAAYEVGAKWLSVFRTTDYKQLQSAAQMPGSSYTTDRFQQELDNYFPSFKSESIKNKDTRQVKSIELADISFNQIPQLNNQEGAFIKFVTVINAAKNGGNYWVSKYEERVILLQVNGVWKVDSEQATQLEN
ncbi:hypothetical protein [Dehalobacter sp. TeCB1]|uniref:hypothetical protein n=1 Tax=Dehalobacter sp. TeCB1 TaxID=1843715 RepID=UPI00083BA206|nr:hypothetical protein [Dehalobacter sp. TeCB1]OCZ49877.1 hypothetical protein A7D23_00580 [Dehalobacter sp. TeCB1]